MTGKPILVPQLTDTMHEGLLVSWTKGLGERIARGDTVGEIETDKAVMDIVVFDEGFLSGPLTAVGTTVPVGGAIGFVVASEAEIDRSAAAAAPSRPPGEHGVGGHGVEPVPGTRAAGTAMKVSSVSPPESSAPKAPAPRPKGKAATPWARALSAQLAVPLPPLTGTGPRGEIVGADVIAARPAARGRPMTPIEAATARAMAASLEMPTFRVTRDLDLRALMRTSKDAGVGVTVAIARACALAMAARPKMNAACCGGDHLEEREQVDVGVAVAADGGLVVPVLRDVARRPLPDLVADWTDLVARARTRRLKPADWEHPTFTVSNMGMLGVDWFDAIPTVGTSAIVAIAASRPDGGTPFTVTADHRVNNGADVAAWLAELKRLVEAPTWLGSQRAIPEGDWDYDVVIVGGGPGGEDCARDLVQHGVKVALVNDSAMPGGECLWRGCIPSKAWRKAADRLRDRSDDARLGIEGTRAGWLDWDVLEAERARILSERGKLALSADKALKIDVIQGWGSFRDAHTLLVDAGRNADDPHHRAGPGDGLGTASPGDVRTIRFGCAVIATGAPPFVPPIPGTGDGLRDGAVLTSDTVWSLPERPRRVAIVGAGAIGCEMAQIFADFGSDVTLLEAQDRVLAEVEAEVARELGAVLAADPRITLAVSVRVTSIVGPPGAVVVRYAAADGEHEITCDRVLMATGKRPQFAGLGLDALGVATERGAITVDAQGRTILPHVFAVGDVVPGLMLAHTAAQQGRVAAAAILGHGDRYDEALDCGVIFTRPQAAFVGLSTSQAKSRGIDAVEVKVALRIDAQAMIAGEEHGLVKLVADAKSQRVVGVHLLADHADALVGAGVLMVSGGMTLSQVGAAIFPHPTQTELFGELARRLLARLRRSK